MNGKIPRLVPCLLLAALVLSQTAESSHHTCAGSEGRLGEIDGHVVLASEPGLQESGPPFCPACTFALHSGISVSETACTAAPFSLRFDWLFLRRITAGRIIHVIRTKTGQNYFICLLLLYLCDVLVSCGCSGCFLGRPRGRMVKSSFNLRPRAVIQLSGPYGRPLSQQMPVALNHRALEPPPPEVPAGVVRQYPYNSNGRRSFKLRIQRKRENASKSSGS